MRYQNIESINNKYNISIVPEIQISTNDIIITSKYGDRLDLLAHKYYNNSRLWWIIAKANNLNGDSFFIQSSIQLVIPNNTNVYIQSM